MSVPVFEEIHIENTNACGYKCTMCPRGEQTRPLGFMSLEDFSLLLERLGAFQGVFHLHGFGEPLLDRHLASKLKELKKQCPSSFALIFSTLGVRLKEADLITLLASGLDGIVISLYGFTVEEYKKVHGYNGFELVKGNLKLLSQAMHSFPAFKGSIKIPAPHLSSSLPIAPSLEKREFCLWAHQLGFEIGQWEYVHNYSNGRHYNLPNAKQQCPVISGKRKNILNITWDLNVIPCCYDFNATISFGNLRRQSLTEIFSSPEYLSFVIAHQSDHLTDYPVCQNCEKYDYV